MLPTTTAAVCLLIFVTISTCSELQGGVPVVAKRALLDGQAECTTLLVAHLTNNDMACINVANVFTGIIVAEDIVNELDAMISTDFAVFCRPSCGKHILTAWSTCNIIQNYEREVQLINGLCSRDHNVNCYDAITEIFAFIQEVEDCQLPEDQCSQNCNNLVDDGEDQYGCCIYIPIDFRSAGGETGLLAVVESTFSKCGEDIINDDCDGIQINFIDDVVEVNQALSPDQIVCITDALASDEALQENDPQCTAAANTLLVQINSESLTTSIGKEPAPLSVFCRSTCGPTVIDSLMSCGAYDDIRAEIDFIVGLCGINDGVPCYTQINALLIDAFDDLAYCRESDENNCPPTCRAVYQEVADELGCCHEVLIAYIDAVIPDVDADEEIDSAFNGCDVERPSQCTTSALSATVQSQECPNGAGGYVPSLSLLVLAMGSALCLYQ